MGAKAPRATRRESEEAEAEAEISSGQRRGAARTVLLPRWGEDGAPALLGAWQSAAEKRQEAGGLSHKVLEQLVCLSKS